MTTVVATQRSLDLAGCGHHGWRGTGRRVLQPQAVCLIDQVRSRRLINVAHPVAMIAVMMLRRSYPTPCAVSDLTPDDVLAPIEFADVCGTLGLTSCQPGDRSYLLG